VCELVLAHGIRLCTMTCRWSIWTTPTSYLSIAHGVDGLAVFLYFALILSLPVAEWRSIVYCLHLQTVTFAFACMFKAPFPPFPLFIFFNIVVANSACLLLPSLICVKAHIADKLCTVCGVIVIMLILSDIAKPGAQGNTCGYSVAKLDTYAQKCIRFHHSFCTNTLTTLFRICFTCFEFINTCRHIRIYLRLSLLL